jgi:hypothetical protein
MKCDKKTFWQKNPSLHKKWRLSQTNKIK